MDDRTVGLVLRALRRRRGWRQIDLAVRAGCSQAVVSQVERGQLARSTLATLRRLFNAVEARLELLARWRGAELDRLIDSDHAAIGSVLARRLERADWVTLHEVTYSIGGERGSIDVLGVREAQRAVLVCEVKSDIPSAEAAGRKLDEKARLARSIVRTRLGWTPETVGVVLVLPEANRLRRLLAGPAAVLSRMYPIESRRVVGWLANPVAPLRATWFLSDIAGRSRSRVARPVRRVSRRATTAATVNLSAGHDPTEPPSRILR